MTGLPAGHAAWLAGLHAAADRSPLRPRLPLRWQGATVGSMEPDFVNHLLLHVGSACGVLQKSERDGIVGWDVAGELTASLAGVASALHAAGLTPAWRNEQLAIADAQGRVLGTVERAVVRLLGIPTSAVHLVGCSPDGRHWVQQRALTKPNDPGLWDTLMGGMVPASDTLEQALERETWEEAGLKMEQLEQLAWGGHLMTRQPATDGNGAGYVLERIDWYRCVLPEGLTPVNQDGEVERFCLLAATDVLGRLMRHEFTIEAALVLTAAGLE